MTVLRLFSLMTLIGLMGCDTQYGYVGEDLAPQVQASKTEQAPPSPQPVATFVTFDSSKSEQELAWVDLASEVKSQKLGPAPIPSSFERYLTLTRKLYLSKAGELIGDLTIENNNFVSVKHITVHCVEYNMNTPLFVRHPSPWRKTLKVGESGYWDQVNFGYVHNDFETVQCKIANAQLS